MINTKKDVIDMKLIIDGGNMVSNEKAVYLNIASTCISFSPP